MCLCKWYTDGCSYWKLHSRYIALKSTNPYNDLMYMASVTIEISIIGCLERDDIICSQYATCKDINGSYMCECVSGFEGNGVECTRTATSSMSKHTIVQYMFQCILVILEPLYTIGSSISVIGTSIAATFVVGIILFLMIIAGSIIIYRHCIRKQQE